MKDERCSVSNGVRDNPHLSQATRHRNSFEYTTRARKAGVSKDVQDNPRLSQATQHLATTQPGHPKQGVVQLVHDAIHRIKYPAPRHPKQGVPVLRQVSQDTSSPGTTTEHNN